MKFARLLILPVWLLLTAIAFCAGHADLLAATCRVTATDGVGTGTAFSKTDADLLILTCAHVAGEKGATVGVEFWRRGHQGNKVPARVVWSSYNRSFRDLAIVAVPLTAFDVPPPRIPLAAAEKLSSGTPVLSVGCSQGSWPTLFQGHALQTSDAKGSQTVEFLPPPRAGRSGSALFSEDGSQIVGIVGWYSQENGYGLAMTAAEIRAALAGKPPAASGPDTHPESKPDPVRRLSIDCTGWRPVSRDPPGERVIRDPSIERSPYASPAQQCPGGRCPTRPGWIIPNTPKPQQPSRGYEAFAGLPDPPAAPPEAAPAPPATPPADPPGCNCRDCVKRDELSRLVDSFGKRLTSIDDRLAALEDESATTGARLTDANQQNTKRDSSLADRIEALAREAARIKETASQAHTDGAPVPALTLIHLLLGTGTAAGIASAVAAYAAGYLKKKQPAPSPAPA